MKEINVVCAIIKNNKNEIMCCQRENGKSLGGYWEFPGGKIEKNETNEQTIIREIKEELNIDIEVNRFIKSTVYQYEFAQVTLHAYECRMITDDIKMLDHQDIKWLSKEEIGKLNWAPADVEIIDYIIEE